MEMMIRPNHHHVDIQGLVYLPYLHEWGTSRSIVSVCLSETEGGREGGREPMLCVCALAVCMFVCNVCAACVCVCNVCAPL